MILIMTTSLENLQSALADNLSSSSNTREPRAVGVDCLSLPVSYSSFVSFEKKMSQSSTQLLSTLVGDYRAPTENFDDVDDSILSNVTECYPDVQPVTENFYDFLDDQPVSVELEHDFCRSLPFDIDEVQYFLKMVRIFCVENKVVFPVVCTLRDFVDDFTAHNLHAFVVTLKRDDPCLEFLSYLVKFYGPGVADGLLSRISRKQTRSAKTSRHALIRRQNFFNPHVEAIVPKQPVRSRVDELNLRINERPKATLLDFLDQNQKERFFPEVHQLSFLGKTYSKDEFLALEPDFRKDKGLFRKCLQYFDDGENRLMLEAMLYRAQQKSSSHLFRLKQFEAGSLAYQGGKPMPYEDDRLDFEQRHLRNRSRTVEYNLRLRKLQLRWIQCHPAGTPLPGPVMPFPQNGWNVFVHYWGIDYNIPNKYKEDYDPNNLPMCHAVHKAGEIVKHCNYVYPVVPRLPDCVFQAGRPKISRKVLELSFARYQSGKAKRQSKRRDRSNAEMESLFDEAAAFSALDVEPVTLFSDFVSDSPPLIPPSTPSFYPPVSFDIPSTPIPVPDVDEDDDSESGDTCETDHLGLCANSLMNSIFDVVKDIVPEGMSMLGISRFFVLLHQVSTVNSIIAFVEVVFMFVSGDPVLLNYYNKHLKSKVEAFLARFAKFEFANALFQTGVDKTGMTYQAQFSAADIPNPTQNAMLLCIWDILSSIGIFNLLTVLNVHDLFDFTVLREKIVSILKCQQVKADTVLKIVAKSFFKILMVLKRCIDEKSLYPLLEGVIDYEGWVLAANAVVTYNLSLVRTQTEFNSPAFQVLRSQELIPKTWIEPFVSVSAFQAEIAEIIAQGATLLKMVRDASSISSIKTFVSRLHAMVSFCNTIADSGALRYQPLGIFFHGSPGVGKSVLCNSIFENLAFLRGYSIEPPAKYILQMNVNFHDNWFGQTWLVQMDDIDQVVAPPVMGQENHVTTVIRVINTTPCPIEKASIEEKGRVFAHPLVALYTSNYAYGRLLGYCLDPRAFWRRFQMHVTVEPADGYGKGGTLDLDAVRLRPTPNVNKITVRLYDAAKWDSHIPYESLPFGDPIVMNNCEFSAFVARYFDRHLAKQDVIVRANAAEGSRCARCGFKMASGTLCECKVYQAGLPRWSFGAILSSLSLLLYNISFNLFFYAVGWGVGQLISEVIMFCAWLSACTTRVDRVVGTGQFIMADANLFCATVRDLKTSIKNGLKITKNVALVGTAIGAFIVAYKVYAAYQKRLVYQSLADNMTENVPINFTRLGATLDEARTMAASTFTYDDILRSVAQSHWTITREADGVKVHGYQLGHAAVLMNDHVFVEGGNLILQQGDNTFRVKMVLGLTYQRSPLGDYGVLQVTGLPAGTGILKKFWTSVDSRIRRFDELHVLSVGRDCDLSSPCLMNMPTSNFNGDVARVHGGTFVAGGGVTQYGDCGKLYLARCNTTWKLVAIHSQYSDIQKVAFGVVVTGDVLVRLINMLGLPYQHGIVCLTQMGKDPKTQSFKPLRLNSELGYAVRNHRTNAFVVGEAQYPVHGATTLSKIRATIYAAEFAADEMEHCGHTPYWVAPIFKGFCPSDGVWISPYQHAFGRLDNDESQVDDYMWWFSIIEYLARIKTLLPEGYRSLTEEEAVRGIPGSVIGSVNLNTSMGPPVNSKKRPLFHITDQGVWMNDMCYASMAELEEIYRCGEIPLGCALWTHKDEAVKYTKFAERNTRVFNVLNGCQNLKSKQICAGVSAFLRANGLALGTAVGINMMSVESTQLIDRLKEVDPLLVNLFFFDFDKMDKAMHGRQNIAAAHVFFFIAKFIGTDPLKAFSAMVASKSLYYVLNNDFFQLGGTNPSGDDKTVERNGISNICSNIYCYNKTADVVLTDVDKRKIRDYVAHFLEDPLALPVFQQPFVFYPNCALVTYGDDGLGAHRKRIDMEKYAVFMRQLGYTITDASKEKTIAYGTLKDADFLKRKFVFCEELQRYLTPLSMKSVLRTLRTAKPSVMSNIDHDSLALEEALRELVYHGRETFDRYRDRFEKIRAAFGLNAAFCPLNSYDFYWAKVKDGSFQTWVLEYPEIDTFSE